MATALLPNINRENIEINPNTFRILTIKAEGQGTNLKNYITMLLDKNAEDEEDLLLFNAYVKNNPECWQVLNEEEHVAFEKEMGL